MKPNSINPSKFCISAIACIAVLGISEAALADNLDFLIYNESSADLVEFNVSSSNAQSWDGNLMRGGYLAPGYEIDVVIADGLETCIYDIRGVFDDGSTAEEYDIDVCELGEYTFTD
ncbi:MAG: hypothetical protein AAF641_12590 [Pseudomonadota bacterium]